jgi:phosphohistidine phosphatase
MRHGLAVERDVTTVMDDAKRPLTSEGKQKMREIASGLERIGVEADWIVSSPLVRAVETAEIVAEGLGSKPPLDICEALRPGGAPEALIGFLAKRSNRRRVFVVGHEPDLGELAARLIGAGRNASLPFKKGGCCLITFSVFPPKSPGRLVWWLPPRILRKMG